jgi:hypothetical protein
MTDAMHVRGPQDPGQSSTSAAYGEVNLMMEKSATRRVRLLRAVVAATALSAVLASGAFAAKPVPSVTVMCDFYPGDTTVSWTGFHGVRAAIEYSYRDFFFIVQDVTYPYEKLTDHSLSVQSPADTGGARSGTARATVWDRNGNSYSGSVSCN